MLVVGPDIEVTAFDEVLKVFDGQVNGQQLSIKGAVLCLGRCKLPGKIGEGAPGVSYPLLQDCAHRGTGSIREDASGRIGSRMYK